MGCDRDLDETRQFDHCMKCGGDDSTCELFTDFFKERNKNCPDEDENSSSSEVDKDTKKEKYEKPTRGRARLHRKHLEKTRLRTEGKCGNETITIFQVPSGATHLTVSQNSTANNFIRTFQLALA